MDADAGGHWEAYCGDEDPKLRKAPAERQRDRERSLLELAEGHIQRLTTEIVFKAARLEDLRPYGSWRGLGRQTPWDSLNIVNIYDPELITVGGSIALNDQELIQDP